jgi:Putative peptidoglycan binding domain
MKTRRIALYLAAPVIVLFLFALTAEAATPTLSLFVSSGDSVQVSVTGDANATVTLTYNSGAQTRSIGTTDSSGHLSSILSSSGIGASQGLPVYVTVNGQLSNSMPWPTVGAATTGGTITLSQNNITLTPGQSTTLTLFGGSNAFFISNNSNSSTVSFLLSGGNQITATGVAPGSTTATICDQGNLASCVSLSATTQSGGSNVTGSNSSIAFSPNNVNVNSNSGTIIISISGGSNYTITSNSNPSALNASINGGSIDLTANNTTPASASVTVCSSGTSSCGVLNVGINGGAVSSSSIVTFSQSAVSMSPGASQSVTITGSGGYTVSSNSNPGIVTPSINGNTLTLLASSGTAAASATITVCQQSGGCGMVTVSTNGSSSTGNQISFSQSSPTLSIGQSITVTLTGGNGSYFVSSNPSPAIAGTSLINGNGLVLSGIANGSDTITVCASSGGCGSLTLTVGNSSQTSGAVSFSQTNPAITVGQTLPITLSGGAGTYFISSSQNSAVQASISASTLTLLGQAVGTSPLSVCSTSGGCSVLTVTVTGAVQPAVVVPAPVIPPAPTITGTTPLNTGALLSILGQIQQLTNLLVQLEVQAITQLQQQGIAATSSAGSVANTSSHQFNSNLSTNSSGSEVKALQERLSTEGLYSGPINGAYGASTVKAVKAYQARNGIGPLGIVGPATRNALNGN